MIFTEPKVIKVYYNKGDKKPYDVNGKPISYFGEDYIGANEATQLRFYLGNDLGEGITPIVVSKRADGERKLDILTEAIDTSVTPNQAFYYVDLQNWYVQKVGKLTIALKVYSGEVVFDADPPTEIVSSTGRIIVSDIFHIDCAYAPDTTDLVPEFDPTSWDDVLTAIATKLNKVDGIEVVNVLPTVSTMNNGRWYLLREATGMGHLYVVVSGALTEVELKLGQLDFAITGIPTDALGVGELRYNDTTGALDLGLKGGHVLKIGGALLKRVRNDNGTNLKVGQVVYVSGAVGNSGLLLVKKADYTGETTSSKTFGIVGTAMDTTGNKDGYVYLYGLLQGINLTDGDIAGETFVEGDVGKALWLGASGKLLKAIPTGDAQHSVFVGYLESWQGNGSNCSIYVKVQNGYELGELHDVRLASKVNGDVLVWDSARGVWKNSNRLTTAEATIDSQGNAITSLGSTKADITYVDSQDNALDARIDFIEDNGGIDFIKVANFASLPTTGAVREHRLYMTIDTKQLWEWDGTQWNESSPTDLTDITVSNTDYQTTPLIIDAVDNTEVSLFAVKLDGTTKFQIDDGGNTIAKSNLIVEGNLTVNGTQTTVNTETINMEDNIILINSNQTGTPSSVLKSGIEVERGDETNYQFVFDESDDRFKVGQVGSLQTVATRQDDGTMTDNGIPIYSATNKRFETDTELTWNSAQNRLTSTQFLATELIYTPSISTANGTPSANISLSSNGTVISRNIASPDANPALIVNLQQGDGNIAQFRKANSTVAYVLGSGTIVSSGNFASTGGLVHSGSADNASILSQSTGALISRNVADANPALKVNLANAGASGNILEVQTQGTNAFTFSRFGEVNANGLSNLTSGSNARVAVATTGTTISRNQADTNPALIINLANSGSTGDIVSFQNQGVKVASITTNGSLRTNVIYNNTSSSNAYIWLSDNGTLIQRNQANSYNVLTVNQANTSATGNLVEFQFGGTPKLEITKDGYLTKNGTRLFHQTGDTTNTFFGNSVANLTLTGSNNTAFGSSALITVGTGYSNTAIGANSLLSTTGNNNTAIGRDSGHSITTGSENIFVGREAGKHASQKVDATNSTAIGYQAYTDANNQMVFGNGSVTEFKFDRNTSASMKAPRVEASSASIHTFNRTSADTNNGRTAIVAKHTTTGDMVDLFGANVGFAIQDTAGVENIISYVGTKRSGADNSGRLVFHTFNAGTDAEKMTIMPDGKVGIGTSAPATLLSVITASNADGLQIRRNSANTNDYATIGFRINTTEGANNYAEVRAVRTNRAVGGDSDLRFATYTNGTLGERVTIRDDGRVGIGTTSPATILNLSQTSEVAMRLDSGSYTAFIGLAGSAGAFSSTSGAGDIVLRANTGHLIFSNSTTERVRFTSDGKVGIGLTAPTAQLEVKAGTTSTIPLITDTPAGGLSVNQQEWRLGGSTQAYVTADGDLYNLNGTYGTISDLRVKENIVDARNYTEDLMKLRVVKYSLKKDQEIAPTKLGFIAQEVEQVFPAMVETQETAEIKDLKSIKMSVLIPMLVKTIQELKKEIDTLKGKVG